MHDVYMARLTALIYGGHGVLVREASVHQQPYPDWRQSTGAGWTEDHRASLVPVPGRVTVFRSQKELSSPHRASTGGGSELIRGTDVTELPRCNVAAGLGTAAWFKQQKFPFPVSLPCVSQSRPTLYGKTHGRVIQSSRTWFKNEIGRAHV